MELVLAEATSVTLENNRNAFKHDFSSMELSAKLEPRGTVYKNRIRDKYIGGLRSKLGIDSGGLVSRNPVNFYLLGRIKPGNGVNQENYSQGKGGQLDLHMSTHGRDNLFHRILTVFTGERKELEATAVCNASVRVRVNGTIRLLDGSKSWAFESDGFMINKESRETEQMACWTNIQLGGIPEEITLQWITGRKKITCDFTVILVLNDEAMKQMLVYNLFHSPASSTLLQMLENEKEADVVIVPGGGDAKPVKCHRAYLAARTPYFMNMFESEMQEATTNTIQIPTMSESEVRVFVKYLYTWDVQVPLEDCEIALKMLKAGHLFQVADLCETMYEIMIMKSSQWFSVDVAVELLSFTKKLCGSTNDLAGAPNKDEKWDDINRTETLWQDLKMVAVQVLKWYSMEAPDDLMKSVAFKNFHLENPEIAMELQVSLLRCLDIGALSPENANIF